MITEGLNKFLNKHSGLKKIIKILNKFTDDDIFGLSAELTFYLTMSFFPFIILFPAFAPL